MREKFKIELVLLHIFLFNILIASSVILLHETGHFVTGVFTGCKNIKLVLIDSELGTYTEMNCPNKQVAYFPLIGAFLLTLPYTLCFLLLGKSPEKNFFWMGLGFNFTISIMDMPLIISLQIFILVLGLLLIVFGEILLIDKLLLFIVEKV